MTELHPYYQAHRPAMDALMRQRLDLADGLVRDRLELADTAALKREIMAEFEIVLHQMPYVGGPESRMTDFFMRFLGLMAIGRVLRRRDVPFDVISEITLKCFTAQLLATPEADRLEAGRQFMSPENRDVLRKQADWSRKQPYPADFVYELVEPGPGDKFEFGIDYRACGFCKFAAEHGDKDLLPLTLRPTPRAAYIWSERKQLPVAQRTAISGSVASYRKKAPRWRSRSKTAYCVISKHIRNVRFRG